MNDDLKIYCNCIERVRHHITVAESVLSGKINTGLQELNTEIIFLRLRKTLEEIAFASLSANREKYSEARAGFATEWNARRMLGFLENINPNFYPIPLKAPQEIAPGQKHFDLVKNDYLTKDDFIFLYDRCAEVLHCRNPYSLEDPTINIKYTVEEWFNRIKTLLSWHSVQLVDSLQRWVIQVQNEGAVQLFSAAAQETLT